MESEIIKYVLKLYYIIDKNKQIILRAIIRIMAVTATEYNITRKPIVKLIKAL